MPTKTYKGKKLPYITNYSSYRNNSVRQMRNAGFTDTEIDEWNTYINKTPGYRRLTDGNIVNSVIKQGNYGGGSWGSGGSGGRWTPQVEKQYTYNEILPSDTIYIPHIENFNDAFARARRQGLDKFKFNNKIYTTEIGNNPNWKQAGEGRMQGIVLPFETIPDTIKRKSNVPRKDTILTNQRSGIENGIRPLFVCGGILNKGRRRLESAGKKSK